jgi:hypothetical protein
MDFSLLPSLSVAGMTGQFLLHLSNTVYDIYVGDYFAISGFQQGVNKTFTLLGCYAVFWDNVSVPPSRVKLDS